MSEDKIKYTSCPKCEGKGRHTEKNPGTKLYYEISCELCSGSGEIPAGHTEKDEEPKKIDGRKKANRMMKGHSNR
jgi:DnaJ-class molecular chaperone